MTRLPGPSPVFRGWRSLYETPENPGEYGFKKQDWWLLPPRILAEPKIGGDIVLNFSEGSHCDMVRARVLARFDGEWMVRDLPVKRLLAQRFADDDASGWLAFLVTRIRNGTLWPCAGFAVQLHEPTTARHRHVLKVPYFSVLTMRWYHYGAQIHPDNLSKKAREGLSTAEGPPEAPEEPVLSLVNAGSWQKGPSLTSHN